MATCSAPDPPAEDEVRRRGLPTAVDDGGARRRQLGGSGPRLGPVAGALEQHVLDPAGARRDRVPPHNHSLRRLQPRGRSVHEWQAGSAMRPANWEEGDGGEGRLCGLRMGRKAMEGRGGAADGEEGGSRGGVPGLRGAAGMDGSAEGLGLGGRRGKAASRGRRR